MLGFPALFPLMLRPRPLVFLAITLGLIPGAMCASILFQTLGTNTVSPGRLETSVAWLGKQRPGERDDDRPAFELVYGATERMEVNYESSWTRKAPAGLADREGYGNSAVGLKWRLLDQVGPGVAVALKSEFEFRNPGSDSASRGLVADENTAKFQVCVQSERAGLILGASLGRTLPSQSNGTWDLGVVAKKKFGARVVAGVELKGRIDPAFARGVLLLNVAGKIKLGADSRLLLGLSRELENGTRPRTSLLTRLGWEQTF